MILHGERKMHFSMNAKFQFKSRTINNYYYCLTKPFTSYLTAKNACFA